MSRWLSPLAVAFILCAQAIGQSGREAAVCRVRSPDGGGYSAGSGTLIAVDNRVGFVLTAAHVIAGARGEPDVTFPDGTSSGAPIVKADSGRDLALLRIWKPKGIEPVPLAPAVAARGESLTIGGFGGQGNYREATGRLSHFLSGGKWLELTQAQARSGDSGGPIFTSDGALAGCLWGAGEGTTVGSHVKSVRDFLPEECQRCLPGYCPPIRPQPQRPTNPGTGPGATDPGQIRPTPTPVPPPTPQPQPPQPDAAIIAKLDAIVSRLDALEKRKPEQGPPGPKGDAGPPGKDGKDAPPPSPPPVPVPPPADTSTEPKVSHLVLIADTDDPSWQRIESGLLAARAKFSRIQVCPSDQVPFRVTTLPQVVTYDTRQTPMAVAKGQYQVESMLQRVARGELKF